MVFILTICFTHNQFDFCPTLIKIKNLHWSNVHRTCRTRTPNPNQTKCRVNQMNLFYQILWSSQVSNYELQTQNVNKMNWNLGVIIYRLSDPGLSQEFALLRPQERKGASFMGPNLSDVYECKWVFKISLCWVLPSDCFYCCYFISSFSSILLKEHDHWLFHTHIFIDANGLKPVEIEI